MELTKDFWSKNDAKDFQKYLISLGQGEEKAKWEKRIINTSFPCLAIPAPKIKQIAKKIGNGNFLKFLELNLWEYHQNTIINGLIICKIKDFDLQKKYLLQYATRVDNWASIDSLKFKFTKDNKALFMSFAKEILHNENTFVRRLSLIIMLKLAGEETFVDEIFKCANSLYEEKEYYVNMANAWLLCEMFIKHRDRAIEFLKNHNLNDFVLKKMISKCKDSYRISDKDKENLKKML